MRKVAKHGQYAGWQNVCAILRELEPFTNSSRTWRGEHVRPEAAVTRSTGRLEGQALINFKAACLFGIDYIVWSYGTPIAWRYTGDDGNDAFWVRPDVSYSATTTHHQRQTFVAIDQLPS